MMNKRRLKTIPKESVIRTTLLLSIIFGVSVSCLRDPELGDVGAREMSVQQYVTLLQSGKFNADEVPVFDISHIPELLKHIRDERQLTFYPWNNPVSSIPRFETKSTVGMVILWTIEGTRLDIDFPSETPTVRDKTDFRQIPQSEVVNLYEKWWEKNKGKTARELKENSPLEATNLIWH